MVRHERLSEALCEAVEFGHPTMIRLGVGDWTELLASIDKLGVNLSLSSPPVFDGVPVTIEKDRTGCVVEHDRRYEGPASKGVEPHAIPSSVAMDRKTREPVIVAW